MRGCTRLCQKIWSKTINQPKRSSPKLEHFKTVWKRLRKNKAAVVGGFFILLFIIVSIVGPLFTTQDPTEVDVLNKLKSPSAEHWFGTDNFGRDIFTRIIHGMAFTFKVGFLSVAIGGVIGVVLGIVSGYYGGAVDTIIMRIMDVF